MSNKNTFNDAEFADVLSVLSEYLPPEDVVIDMLHYLRDSDVSTIAAFIEAAMCHEIATVALPYIRRYTAGADSELVADRLIVFLDTVYPNLFQIVSSDEVLLDKFSFAFEVVLDKLCK